MKPVTAALLAVLVAPACLATHVTKEIPPPGGCSQCHRQKISANWEIAVAPVPFGKEGGVPQPSDLALRGLQSIPYHANVPSQRLSVYAASAPSDAIGDDETGTQCFVCHTDSSGPPHEKQMRGRHLWTPGVP